MSQNHRQSGIGYPANNRKKDIIMNHFVGLYGVVSAQLISDCITFIFSTLIYRSVYNKLQSGLGDADKLLSDN